MGPNEAAITLPGGPRISSVINGSGRCRAQIKHFFGMQTGSRTPHGLGLMVGGRLHRMRMRFGHPTALKALELLIMPGPVGLPRELVDNGPSASVCSVCDCICLLPLLGEPYETCGPRFDSIPPARLTTSAPRIKKLFFSAPSNRPIDLVGPGSDRTTLEQLQHK